MSEQHKNHPETQPDVPASMEEVVQSLAHIALETDSTENEQIAPPRVAELHNGHIESKNGAALITPDTKAMDLIEFETDGKVRYFPARDSEKFIEDAPRKVNEPAYFTHVTEPLVKEIIERFPDKRVALRGISTSINGQLPPESEGGYDLWDITQTIKAGTEKIDTEFNVAVLNPNDPLTVHRVNQYAFHGGMARKFEVDEYQRDSLFPAILVYDSEGLTKTGGSWSVKFREGHDPEETLLAAYVLDCPDV